MKGARKGRKETKRKDAFDSPDFVGELLSGIKGGDLDPIRLVDSDAIENGRELVSILSVVDHVRVGSEDVDSGLLESKSDVLGELTFETRKRKEKREVSNVLV